MLWRGWIPRGIGEAQHALWKGLIVVALIERDHNSYTATDTDDSEILAKVFDTEQDAHPSEVFLESFSWQPSTDDPWINSDGPSFGDMNSEVDVEEVKSAVLSHIPMKLHVAVLPEGFAAIYLRSAERRRTEDRLHLLPAQAVVEASEDSGANELLQVSLHAPILIGLPARAGSPCYDCTTRRRS